ncbi:MAG: hypothetical protein HQL33_07690 [Alphaproteobacteria bacterium]|nr:hypothetical protein [Alphaproteobacteria bacterium]MBF0129860.1 hypothetical protein [Alphaproteobacteria bacterium]
MRVFFVSVVMTVVLTFAVLTGSAAAESAEALSEARQKLTEEYRAAVREVQLMQTDHRIAMEQLKISLTRKDLGKPQTPEMSAAYSEKVRGLAQKQEKQIAPLQKKRRDMELKLRENALAQQKLRLDERRKGASSQGGAR